MKRRFLSAIAISVLFAGIIYPAKLCGAKNAVSHLDADALELHITSGKALQKTFAYWQQALDNMVWENDLEHDEIRSLLIELNSLELMASLLGFQELEAIGSSSSELSEKLIHNRIFLQFPAEAQGLLNTFPAGNNHIDTVKELRVLPEGTFLALFADIRPEASLDALAKTGEFGEQLLSGFPANFPLRELLQSAAGKWSLLMLNCDGDICLKLTIPDPESKHFNIAGLLASERSASRLKIGETIICKSNRELIVYIDGKSEKEFLASPLVRTEKLYPGLFKRLPEKSFMACFINPAIMNPDQLKIGKLKLDINRFDHPAAAAAARENGGILAVLNSTENILTLKSSLLVFIASMVTEENLIPANVKTQFPAPVKAPQRVIQVEKCECRKLLEAAKEVKAPGFYRLENGKPVSCSAKDHQFVCFGSITSVPAAAQLVAKPHNNQICVWFADGQFEKFTLVKPDKYKRVAGFLQTVRMYDEKIFRQLIECAEKLDLEKGE